jgi:hypothetical protein
MVIPFARSLTPHNARKVNALRVANKNGRSLCCAPWHRRLTTTGVTRLAIIPFLSATRFMVDSIRGSLGKTQSELQQFIPHITLAQALDGFVQSGSLLDCAFELGKFETAGRILDQPLFVLAHPQVAHCIV